MSKRQECIRYKMLPNGNLRAYRSDRRNKGTVPEKTVYNGGGVSPTLTSAHVPMFYTIRRIDMTTETKSKKGAIYTDPTTGHKYEIRIRKYTPRDCFRLMGVRDADFDKLMATDANGKRLISNSKLYQLAGNSIVTDCMVAMFEELFYPSGKHTADKHGQLSLF